MEGDIHQVDGITSVKSADKENNNNLQAKRCEMACTSSAHWGHSNLFSDFQITNNFSISSNLL